MYRVISIWSEVVACWRMVDLGRVNADTGRLCEESGVRLGEGERGGSVGLDKMLPLDGEIGGWISWCSGWWMNNSRRELVLEGDRVSICAVPSAEWS